MGIGFIAVGFIKPLGRPGFVARTLIYEHPVALAYGVVLRESVVDMGSSDGWVRDFAAQEGREVNCPARRLQGGNTP